MEDWSSGTARRGDGTAAVAAVEWVRRRAGRGSGAGGGGFGDSLQGRRSSSPADSGSSAMACLKVPERRRDLKILLSWTELNWQRLSFSDSLRS